MAFRVNGYYITPRLTRRLEQILGKEGIEPIVVELSEFQKAGGSVAVAQDAAAIEVSTALLMPDRAALQGRPFCLF